MHNLSENFEEESDGLVQLEKLRGALTEFSQKRLKTEFQILFLETEKYFQNIEEDLPLSAKHRAAPNAHKLHNFQNFKIDMHM